MDDAASTMHAIAERWIVRLAQRRSHRRRSTFRPPQELTRRLSRRLLLS